MHPTAQLVAFVMTTDAARARPFYEDILGLRFISEDDFALAMDAHGITIRITKMKTWVPMPHTVVGFEVPDVEADVRALADRGVQTERYGFLDQDELGIWSAPGGRARIAWFKDPDGNVLSFSQHAG
jgi:catechol 2,3-dioxygenase-like lactoylglutathione lyase family enzyme